MSCYREEWPLLIIVPASMRLVWAEAAELWIPGLRPSDIAVILGKADRIYEEDKRPPIVITSYHMFK
jgi:SNF2 family DNA or RNA helicase